MQASTALHAAGTRVWTIGEASALRKLFYRKPPGVLVNKTKVSVFLNLGELGC